MYSRRSRIGAKRHDISRRYAGGEIFRKKSPKNRWFGDFKEKSSLSLQRDMTAQITPMLIQWPDLNLNGNKEIQRPDCSQIVIQQPKLNFNGNLRF